MQLFYGRAAELECSIREGNVSVEREQFIERMEQLAEAISFFSSHPTYQNQLDSMVFFLLFVQFIILLKILLFHLKKNLVIYFVTICCGKIDLGSVLKCSRYSLDI